MLKKILSEPCYWLSPESSIVQALWQETQSVLLFRKWHFRLLSEEEIVMPSVPTKVRIEKQVMFEASLANAEKLLNMGMHSQAILEYGTIMERLLKALYTKYLPNLPIENKEKMVNYEKEIKAPINKFTLGQWIGLFQRARSVQIYRTREESRK